MKLTTTLTLIGVLCACSSQPKIDRTKAPDTPPLAPVKLPAPRESKLDNGLGIVMVPDSRLPLVTMRLVFRGGSRLDPQAQPGLAETVASLMKAGTPSRSAQKIAEELAVIGGTLDANATPDAMWVSGSVLAEHTGALLEITADIVRNSNFPQDEIDLRKQNRIQELELQRSQAETLGDEKLHAVVFGSHPLSRTLPTPQSILSIRQQDLLRFREQNITPSNAVLIVVGALPANITDMIGSRLGDWPKKDVTPAASAELPKPTRSLTLIDRPGSAQVDILAGHLGVTRTDPDYFPLLVASNILGGGASSRMFVNIREKQGFAYNAGAHHAPYRDTGFFTATTQVREEVLEPAMKSVFAEMDRMAGEPVPAEELSNVKNYLNGTFVMNFASQDGVASQLASNRVNELPPDYLEKYVTRIRSVEPDQIQKAAAKYLSSADASVVIVGDASRIRKTVEKFGKVTVEKAK
ncbi:MAG: insulinase family protein [Bryobacterales bacterium]|nr:insulinase family protein [Bryobacterales bacterium]